jgi:hypothetical protein
VVAPPISYMMDGKQYIAVAAGFVPDHVHTALTCDNFADGSTRS